NANGKVDRGKLPEPGISIEKQRDISQPTNEVEQKLLTIWSKVLGIEEKHISIDDNFFKIGGHSLKAISMMGRIHKELDVKVELLEMIKTPSIRQIASLIEAIGWVKEEKIEDDLLQPIDEKKHVKEIII
ncbi:MAG: phosphopantetheine-binding protein, partial [Candidatus Aminicenantes bacterium]|nr:phosphopantetheine-binding protein [Candidatus Aminicenantes bacterium]